MAAFNLARLAQGTLRRFGWELRRVPPASIDRLASAFPDLSADERAIIDRVQPYTMTSPDRLAVVVGSITHIVKHRIPGAIVECGVWRGGSMMAAALTLRALGDTSRPLFLFDTFEGLPPPTHRDVSYQGEAASSILARETPESDVRCHAGLADVQANLRSTGYPAELLTFVRGKVEDTLPQGAPSAIALLRLDTDWYESTRHELIHLYPRVQPHGIVILDDYGHWQGARRAVDEYLVGLAHPTLLHRIDYTGRVFVKQGDRAPHSRDGVSPT